MSKCHSILPLRKGYFSELTLTSLYHALRSKQITSVELVEHALDEINTLNPVLNAFSYVATEKAIADARHADKELSEGIDRGMLQGIPLGIKDNIMTADMPTTMGSAHYKDYFPENDAECVERLKQAGMIIVGKTTTHEFAYGPTGDCALQGATVNPWDLSRMPGGSSSGSAVAVAAGIIPAALGTDTGGSIRIPAAMNGVVGFKPTMDRISTAGVFPLSSTLDHVGILANNVRDVSLIFNSLSLSFPDMNRESQNIGDLNCGWVNPYCFSQCNPVIVNSIKTEIKNKQKINLVNAFEVDELSELMRVSFGDIQRSEAYEIHEYRVKNNPKAYQQETLERLLLSQHVKGWEYVRAKKGQHQLQIKLNKIFRKYDVLVMPTVPIYAPKLYERELSIEGGRIKVRDALLSLTSPWNLLGFPSVSIPCGLENGLPIGVQIVADHGRDDYLLKVAGQLFERR
ncbi:TPA: amidase [Yersinia enterocolitica]